MRKINRKIKAIIMLAVSLLIGGAAGSTMHLISDVHAEEPKQNVYIYAIDNEHPDVFVDTFNVSIYDENGDFVSSQFTHRKNENQATIELPAGDYTLKINSTPNNYYYDSEGQSHWIGDEDFLYFFDSLETSFTVEDKEVYLELPVTRKTAYNVRFEYQDVTDPSLTVYTYQGPPYLRIYNENGEFINTNTYTFVEDLKLDELSVPTTDPSGGALTDCDYYYAGT